MISGFINLNKPNTISSNKALGVIKHLLWTQNIKEKIGHLGTLDPLASGVLPVALGRATRLFDYSLEKTKVYTAEFIFGADSPSLDFGTEVTYSNLTMPSRVELESTIKKFVGEIEQVPPAFSAKNIGGVRAYKLARKGEEFSLQPKKVKIFDITLIKIMDNSVSLRIKCGGGTYIRALGRDIASLFGTTAVMSSLVREQSGIFSIDNALSLDEIEKNPEKIIENILPIEKFVEDYEKIALSDVEVKQMLDGVHIENRFEINTISAAFQKENLVGIVNLDKNNKIYMKTWLL